ncbi:hypothetical protein HMPREF3048_08080 [Corynebacterium sp. HMSC075D04]|uniref:DUF3180 domain-containing protein n=1 Tax=unclassified Corynebacterium TaxID=2624378 RepID=UPI0008A5065D|nr:MULTISPECIES: DUF3180 domain-containing protein [unclassified Corynebacterium]OFO34691.1 hypothetical protein HMPREF3048_08080 [Corynebacterium sp. HMSC075D04]OFU57834.1 hypothetical protein HMPREF3120_01795 [Corynebacterium sp. HMSC11D10]
MKRTPIEGIIAAAGFSAAAALIVVRRYYSWLESLDVIVPLSLWCIAAVAGWLAWVVHKRRKDGQVGLDRSQLNPMQAANFMVFGKASAWAGAICGGMYAGALMYVVRKLDVLAAASDDVVPLTVGTLGGIALCVAGLVLEKNCEVSPPADGQGVG